MDEEKNKNPWIKYKNKHKDNPHINYEEIVEMWEYYWGKKQAKEELDLDDKRYQELEI